MCWLRKFNSRGNTPAAINPKADLNVLFQKGDFRLLLITGALPSGAKPQKRRTSFVTEEVRADGGMSAPSGKVSSETRW